MTRTVTVIYPGDVSFPLTVEVDRYTSREDVAQAARVTLNPEHTDVCATLQVRALTLGDMVIVDGYPFRFEHDGITELLPAEVIAAQRIPHGQLAAV